MSGDPFHRLRSDIATMLDERTREIVRIAVDEATTVAMHHINAAYSAGFENGRARGIQEGLAESFAIVAKGAP